MPRLTRASANRTRSAIVAAVLGGAMVIGVPAAATGDTQTAYVVVAERGASTADVVRAIGAAGGTVTSRNDAIGTLTVLGPSDGFVEAVSASSAVFGASSDRGRSISAPAR